MQATANIKVNGSIVYLRVDHYWYCYDVRRPPIGVGAMGTVYLGYNCTTGGTVAIKRINDKYSNDPIVRQLAMQEARYLYRHPNMVEMIGCCTQSRDSGPIFTVSKFVKGENIDDYVRNYINSLDDEFRIPRVVELMYPVLDALDYLHSNGVIHCDIKPSNIIVENGKNVRLMDLGISVQQTIDQGGVNISSSGTMGTPLYAAPEQFSNVSKVDATTDIYEVGVTLYELLARFNPFKGSSLKETANRHRNMELPESDYIPKPVLNVLRVATNPEQSKRYGSALEMKQALEVALTIKESIWSRKIITLIAVIIIVVGAMLTLFLLWNN